MRKTDDYGMEAGKSGTLTDVVSSSGEQKSILHSSCSGEVDFGKKVEVGLSGFDPFSPRLLASSVAAERCCRSMTLQSAWIQRLRAADWNPGSKSPSKVMDMPNDLCFQVNQNLPLDSDGQSDRYTSPEKADRGFVERNCIAQVFEKSGSPSLFLKKPKLDEKQMIAFDEVSERLVSKSNALQLLSSDSKDVSGKNRQVETSKQVLEKLQDLNEASRSSPTERSVPQSILSSKAESLGHGDAENLATHMELTRIPYESNVAGFGPFRTGSRNPPLPQSKNSRIICSKATNPPESQTFQYKVVKLGAWSKRKYSIQSEASKQWVISTEDRSGKLTQIAVRSGKI